MIKPLFLGLLLASLPASALVAQTISGDNLSGGNPRAPSPTPASDTETKKPAAEQGPQGPTTIDSTAMDYDEKTRVAIFTGEDYGVFVKDPQFTIYCDKLTAYMRNTGGSTAAVPGKKGKPSPTPTPTPTPQGKAGAATAKAGGLERAIAEGPAEHPVVIVQDKPATTTDQAQHNVGIAQKADYNADTGDIILTGWPRVSQGINTQIATASTTVMIMNKDGKTMTTKGPSRSTIQEQDQPKKTHSDSGSPADQSPSQ